MTQEEKELLFKDLSARLPYHVRCKIWLKDGTTEEGPLDLEHNYVDVLQDAFYYKKIKDIKPYLRPMSSMTDEEFEKFYDSFREENDPYDVNIPQIDWLIANHFDFRDLIPMGLALEAPENMYKI